MASKIFSQQKNDLAFEELRRKLADMAQKLNTHRAKRKTAGFANVFVTEVLIEETTGKATIVVSYSQKDKTMPKHVRAVVNSTTGPQGIAVPSVRLKEVDRKWYEGRDPCCA